ncbi:hypothetical protein Q5P01_024018 [Channa striata]|uniref:Uncharacterized protein n=1 Tax=Channa striata TaxID=64152 RepID=A0AA88LKT7_CHASR|nr:hypothetical protein Q5P01_024018 [Channa striata]
MLRLVRRLFVQFLHRGQLQLQFLCQGQLWLVQFLFPQRVGLSRWCRLPEDSAVIIDLQSGPQRASPVNASL